MMELFLPAIVSTSGRIHRELLRLLFILADRKTTLSGAFPSRPWARPSMSTRRFTAGVAVVKEWDFLAHAGFPGSGVRQAATLCTQVVGQPT